MQINTQEHLVAALDYQKRGFSVFPVGSDKVPLVSWRQFEKRSATEAEITSWWTLWPSANIGVATGAISGIVVIDIEKEGSTNGYSPTVTSRTGGGGWHLYYKHPGVRIKNSTKKLAPFTDVRGDGGYAVLPPSVHASGKEYEWQISPHDTDFADLPQAILEKIQNSGTKTDWKNFAESKVPEGGRNDSAAQYAGKLFHDLSPELWETAGWDSFIAWNQKNVEPPLPKEELRGVWESIRQYRQTDGSQEGSKKEVASQADKIIQIVRENHKIQLFHTDLDEPFILFPVGDHKEYWPCKSKKVKMWIAQEYYRRYKKAPNNDAISTALNVLEASATFEGPEYALANRVSYYDGNIFYSLTNNSWEAVRISKSGWEIEAEPPILFRNYSHQGAQVTPSGSADLFSIFKYINIKRADHQLLLLVWLISSFIPDFPHPILYFHGPQGSAKTTASKILRALIDPSRIEVADFPKNAVELVQMLSHHWCLIFDNVTYISHDLSDLLCRAVSGAGFSKRELYSDDSDVIYTFKRVMGINGISLPALKPDLLERSILLELERVAKDERKEEQAMLIQFRNELPRFLGGIFSAISRALTIREAIVIEDLPRMADFAIWGSAITEALGRDKSEFLTAYTENINLQHDEVINSNVEASFVLNLMADREEWAGSPTELLDLLHEEFGDKKNIKLPKTPSILSNKLYELKINFEGAGISIERIAGRKRKIILRKIPNFVAPAAVVSINTHDNPADGMSENDWFDDLPEQAKAGDLF